MPPSVSVRELPSGQAGSESSEQVKEPSAPSVAVAPVSQEELSNSPEYTVGQLGPSSHAGSPSASPVSGPPPASAVVWLRVGAAWRPRRDEWRDGRQEAVCRC